MSAGLWYASYGSNLSRDRFDCYIEGGRPVGAARSYVGARDSSPPTGVVSLRIPGEVFFGWHSPTWDGGVAFLDLEAPGTALARAYRLTEEQLADVVAQEMHRDPGEVVDVAHLVDHGVLVLGDGRYESLHVVAEVDGEPVVTFTCPEHVDRPAANAPSAPYLRMIAAGLREAHPEVDPLEYLSGLEGVRDVWPLDRLRTDVLDQLPTLSRRGAG